MWCVLVRLTAPGGGFTPVGVAPAFLPLPPVGACENNISMFEPSIPKSVGADKENLQRHLEVVHLESGRRSFLVLCHLLGPTRMKRQHVTTLNWRLQS